MDLDGSAEAGHDVGRIHPAIREIADALTFKIARFAALNERAGSLRFKEAHDISLNQWRILGLTAALGPVSTRQVRDVLYMDRGQFSRVVKQLVERGLIETSAMPSNASAHELRVTAAGKALHDKLIRFTAERNEAVVSILTPDECAKFLEMLDRINSHNEALLKEAGVIE